MLTLMKWLVLFLNRYPGPLLSLLDPLGQFSYPIHTTLPRHLLKVLFLQLSLRQIMRGLVILYPYY